MKKSKIFIIYSLILGFALSSILYSASENEEPIHPQNLTLEERVGQILISFFQGDNVNSEAHILMNRVHIGGIIYYAWANGLHNPDQVRTLSNELQQLAAKERHAIPLFIAVDQEGGRVSRLKIGFTGFPSNGAIGKSGEPERARQIAYTIGSELRNVGINMNLAPVVDVDSQGPSSVMGDRAFSSSPQEVAAFGAMALQGYKESGVIAVLKHFPGYGAAVVDPHLGRVIVQKSREELEQTDLLPFKQLSTQTPALMSAHLTLPSLDPKNCATLSSVILEQLLRKEWGYTGIVLTDSLVMSGLIEECGNLEEAAIRAFEAGNDILLFGGKTLGQKDQRELTAEDIYSVHQALVRAVQAGRISEERLNASVERILALKRSALQ